MRRKLRYSFSAADTLEGDVRDDERHLGRARGQVAALIRHVVVQTCSVRALVISVV